MKTQTPDMEKSLLSVKGLISDALSSVDREVFDFERYPFSFLGKASRARFTLLTAAALGAGTRASESAAAAAELAHTASLLHDDCLDMARYRRGLPTLYDQLGVNSAILVGDLLVSMALECAGKAAPDLPESLVQAVRRMTEGALLEENSRGGKISAETAQRITALKTGSLFRWCALAAGRLAGRPELLAACARLGEGAGCAFQIIDDVLDFEGDPEAIGKETLKDAAEGKITLPLILALNDPKSGPEAERLLAEIRSGGGKDLAPALALAGLVRGGFTAEARGIASARIEELAPVLESLPVKPAAAALRDFLGALVLRSA